MVWIRKAEYIEDYKIHVTFNEDHLLPPVDEVETPAS